MNPSQPTGATSNRKLLLHLKEAWAMALSQRAASIATFAVVAGMCLAVLLTIGRTAGAERRLLADFDALGSRAVVIRAEPSAAIDFSVVARISKIEQVSWVGAFGPAMDVSNQHTGSETQVASRTILCSDRAMIGLPQATLPRTGYATKNAAEALGTPTGVGFVGNADGINYDLAGTIDLPGFLEEFTPLILVPLTEGKESENQPAPVALVVVLADDPANVTAVAQSAANMLSPVDPKGVSINTPKVLAELRTLVENQFGGFGRSLAVMLTMITALLVGVLMFALVMIRRKDFGRRRALGATRSLIVGLIAANTLIVATVAAFTGIAIAITVLIARQDPLPSWQFTLATAILAVAAAGLGAIGPGIVASRRDPLVELRVP